MCSPQRSWDKERHFRQSLWARALRESPLKLVFDISVKRPSPIPKDLSDTLFLPEVFFSSQPHRCRITLTCRFLESHKVSSAVFAGFLTVVVRSPVLITWVCVSSINSPQMPVTSRKSDRNANSCDVAPFGTVRLNLSGSFTSGLHDRSCCSCPWLGPSKPLARPEARITTKAAQRHDTT